jgi:hypothetical protein
MMPKLRTPLNLRAVAGLWFAGFALLGAAGLYGLAVAERDAMTMLVFLGYPTLSAFLAGMILAKWVLSASSSVRAAFAGIGILALSFLIFAFLYALTLGEIGDVEGRLALFVAVVIVGPVMTAPIMLPFAALAGYVLHHIRRRAFRSAQSAASS